MFADSMQILCLLIYEFLPSYCNPKFQDSLSVKKIASRLVLSKKFLVHKTYHLLTPLNFHKNIIFFDISTLALSSHSKT